MGAADLVPGVSGGTVALIAGIYQNLIESLSHIDGQLLKQALQGNIKAAWQHINGNFLLCLVLGAFSSVLLLSHLISYLLDNFPYFLWSFFCGLIIASAYFLYKPLQAKQPYGWLIAGIVFIALIGFAEIQALPINPLTIFFSAMISITAMLLPGISGSFILLLLGFYEPVLHAIKTLDLVFIAIFAAGAAAGIICFSRFLHWLLLHRAVPTQAFLSGLLIGSLAMLWPWKSNYTSSDLLGVNVLPWQSNLGNMDQIGMITLMVAGIALVSLVQRNEASADSQWDPS